MTVQWEALDRGEVDHERLWGAVGLACLALGGLWARQMGLVPLGCVFKAVTGIPCLTCGASRAALALAHGHPLAAFRLHPLVVVGTTGRGGVRALGARFVCWSTAPARALVGS